MERKRIKISEKGYKNFSEPVGKDEVSSSNLDSSSMKSLEPQVLLSKETQCEPRGNTPVRGKKSAGNVEVSR